jgi:hypothetical protein
MESAMPSIRTLALVPMLALAAGAASAADLTPGQLEAAARVYTGPAQCELGKSIRLTPVPGQQGHFKLEYQKASYILVPEETTTGAVRLEDKKAGIVWLQIPAKSMLMNSKIGQRVADDCKHAEQRAEKVALTR